MGMLDSKVAVITGAGQGGRRSGVRQRRRRRACGRFQRGGDLAHALGERVVPFHGEGALTGAIIPVDGGWSARLA
jgi:hypothetical protein